MWLCDTNAQRNREKYLSNPDLESNSYLSHGTLNIYINKTITLVKKLVPNSEFWDNKVALVDISGVKFLKACKRSHHKKSDRFGQESKIGLYMQARQMGPTTFAPHWTFFINCEDICKEMLRATKNGDTYAALTDKRLALTTTKHAVGRGGEAGYLTIPNFRYDPHIDAFVVPWQESKTIR